MEAIKTRFFQNDPDEPVIFHRKELVNKRPPFHPLRNPDVEREFNSQLLDALTRWDYRVITIVLDKLAHRERYSVWHFHPYHYCMTALLERYVLLLHYADARGDVMVERRGEQRTGNSKSCISGYMNVEMSTYRQSGGRHG